MDTGEIITSLNILRDKLRKIEALSTNPHWSADQKEKIADHAIEAQGLVALIRAVIKPGEPL